ILLLGVGLVSAWKLWPSSAIPEVPPNIDELDRSLLAAVRDGDHTKARSLLDQGAYVNARDETGDTALMQAALNSDSEMMRLLLQQSAYVNARNADGVPVLLRAVHDPDKVKTLLTRGARVEERAMVLAAMIPGSRRTLELLVRHGGSVNAEVGGYTAL